jgi:hypothetical protein
MVEKVWSHRRSTFEEQQGMSLVVVARVELPIIKHAPIIKQISNIFLIA